MVSVRDIGVAAALLPAPDQTLPVDSLDDDMRAVFTWLADTRAYLGDDEATRRLVPDVLDFPAWLETTGLTPGGR